MPKISKRIYIYSKIYVKWKINILSLKFGRRFFSTYICYIQNTITKRKTLKYILNVNHTYIQNEKKI